MAMKVQLAAREAYVRITGKRFCQKCQQEKPADGFTLHRLHKTQLYLCEQCTKFRRKG